MPIPDHTQDGPIEPIFFRLPPELRTEVYCLMLPIGNKYEIRSIFQTEFYEEPAALRTNRQIRQEAILIYYQENEWVFHTVNLDARPYIAWTKRSPYRIAANVRWIHMPPHHEHTHRIRSWWSELRHWLEAYYWGQCLDLRATDVKVNDSFVGRYLAIAAQLFEMVHDLRENQGHYWPQNRTSCRGRLSWIS